jgi:hypothetical protein
MSLMLAKLDPISLSVLKKNKQAAYKIISYINNIFNKL